MKRAVSEALTALILIVVTIGAALAFWGWASSVFTAQASVKSFAISNAELFASDKRLYFNIENKGTVAVNYYWVYLFIGTTQYSAGGSVSVPPGGSVAIKGVQPKDSAGNLPPLQAGDRYAVVFRVRFSDGSQKARVAILTAE